MKNEEIKIIAVLRCYEFICKWFDQPTMGAEMVHSELNGISLSTLRKYANKEGIVVNWKELTIIWNKFKL